MHARCRTQVRVEADVGGELAGSGLLGRTVAHQAGSGQLQNIGAVAIGQARTEIAGLVHRRVLTHLRDASVHHLHHAGENPRLKQIDNLTAMLTRGIHEVIPGDPCSNDKTPRRTARWPCEKGPLRWRRACSSLRLCPT